ncbi:MAG: hypothetical protein EOP86_14405 [Verrucomicrobiaceae bacterium]|nr:MAG: hypothetical protein EOP86_14405 [Verrucomicrobiaceae bacterium]
MAFLLWKCLRRPRRAVPPWRLALEKLAASRTLMDSGNAQPFTHAVSEIVRSFIEQSFPVRAAHRTTSEFLHDLVKLPNSPLVAHRATLAEFLEYCDLTKFARWSLTLPEMEAMLSKAQSFISSTGQAAAAVPPGQSVPGPATVPEVRRA